MNKSRETFGSRTAVILALAGSAIGLGNIWRFPYIVGQNGGGAFVVIYIVATVFLSLPIFLAESVIGRRGGSNCRGSMERLAPGTHWKWLGILSVLTPMLIVSYYSVVGGWSVDYLWKSLNLEFSASADTAGMFGTFTSSVWGPIICHTLFLGVSILVVAAGVKKGIERFSKICLPILFVLIVAIAVYSVFLPGARAGVEYLFKPDFSHITARSFVYALGQSFYSLSLGMGIVITYSSYVSRKENLMASAVGTAGFDLMFALLAGLAIMPAVFAGGINPGEGAGLVFDTLPYIFTQMAARLPLLTAVAAILFFLTILVAALTSSVSLLEVGVAYLIEEKGLRRRWACFWVFLATWVVGILCSLSFGPMAKVPLFDWLDKFSSNVLLALGGLLCVIFVGWVMPKADVRDELTSGGVFRGISRLFPVVYFLMKYVAPVAVAVILVTNFLL